MMASATVCLGRRRFLRGGLGVVGLGLLAGCSPVPPAAQAPARLRQIGYLTPLPQGATFFGAFREGLQDLGYAEGKDLSIEYRDAQGDAERLRALAAELVSLPVEIIVSGNTGAIAVASRATSTTPIVAAGGNIVGAGLVTNIAHPEGNITGVATNSVEAVVKWVQLLKETLPTMTRLATLLDQSNVTTRAFLQRVQGAAQSLQLRLRTYDLRELDRLPEVLGTIKAEGAEGLVVVPGGAIGGAADPRIGAQVSLAQLPAVAEPREFAASGGLLAYGPDASALARRAATYVDKIQRGAKPGDLPVEQPTKFNFVLNLNAAQALGLTIPPSVLQQAAELIQ